MASMGRKEAHSGVASSNLGRNNCPRSSRTPSPSLVHMPRGMAPHVLFTPG